MTLSGICDRCGVPEGALADALGLADFTPTHCYGDGDEPGLAGTIGSGFHCVCDCRHPVVRAERVRDEH